MVSIFNVGIPIAFSFSLTENEQIYQLIFDTFDKKLSINLSEYFFESNQGTALQSFFTKNKIKNFVCNRHLLVSLKHNIFSFQIGTMVKCRCQIDLDTSFSNYSDEFSQFLIQYKEQNNKKEFQKKKEELLNALENVGLTFSDRIEISNPERWKQVSLFERISFAIPSTTNSLESSHGHINENVKRRHNFFHAIQKLIKWSDLKISSFKKLLKKILNTL